MNIVIVEVAIQFRNPIIGQPTRRVKEHYYARNISFSIDGGKRQLYRFFADELPFEATEDDMLAAVENKLTSEQKQEQPSNAE